MSPLSIYLSPSQLDPSPRHSNTEIIKITMCLIKNLIAKRSNRNLRNPALSPYPPNIFPFKRESEGETNYESIWDLSPKRESKRESKHGSKSKRESAIVLHPPSPPPPSPSPSISTYSSNWRLFPLSPNLTTTSPKMSTQPANSWSVNLRHIGSRICYGGSWSRRGGIS